MPGPLLMEPRAQLNRRGTRRLLVAVAVLALLIAAAVVQLARGLDGVRAAVVLPRITVVPGRAVRMPWPAGATAAVTVEGVAGLGGERANVVRPLASVTKLITALVVLRQHPLAVGQSGPTIHFTDADATAYRRDLAQGQSVLKVSAGEQLTELQALEGMLIPSADNIARIVARWSAGDSAAFVHDMNREAAALGLRHTHLVGPSGLDPGSVGTAADMVRVGGAVMANPVLRQIVAMRSVTLPVAGTVANYDSVLGQEGIVGIKTGSMSAAGGNFVFAAKHRVDARNVTIIGAVLGAGGAEPLQTALDAAEQLVTAAVAELHRVVLVPAGRRVLNISAGWYSRVPALTTRTATLLAVPGQRLTMRVVTSPQLTARKLHQIRPDEQLATVEIRYDGRTIELPVKGAAKLPPPSLLYRLTRL